MAPRWWQFWQSDIQHASVESILNKGDLGEITKGIKQYDRFHLSLSTQSKCLIHLWSIGEAGGFCGDRRPEGHVFMYFIHHGKPWLKRIIARLLCKKGMEFTQIKSTTAAIDDSNRRRKRIGLDCSQEATTPLILFFKFLCRWLNINLHFKIATLQDILVNNLWQERACISLRFPTLPF